MSVVVKSLPPSAYTVGWICALPLELTSATAMLDEVHQSLPQRLGDNNTYTLGAIRGHNTAIACLPLGRYGITSATQVASSMHSTFPALRFSLLVGIGGGVPGKDADIRLGDVVVSMPSCTHPGVIQYDHGKTEAEGHFQRTGVLNKPPPGLLTATAKLQSKYAAGQGQVRELLAEAVERNPRTSLFTYPGEQYDLLFQAQYEHISKDKTCIDCDHTQLVERKPRMGQEPKVHYGLIASGNQVMKHGLTRDSVAQDLGALCFEMEAAGMMDDFPCLVIRGISDYADSHKLEQWQGYAAATAAAYTKELLSVIPPAPTVNEEPQVQMGAGFLRYLYGSASPPRTESPLQPRLEHEGPKTLSFTLNGQTNAGDLLRHISHAQPIIAPLSHTIELHNAQANGLLQRTLQPQLTSPPLSYPVQSLVQAEEIVSQYTQDGHARSHLVQVLVSQTKEASIKRPTTDEQISQCSHTYSPRQWMLQPPPKLPSQSNTSQTLTRPDTLTGQLSKQTRDSLRSQLQSLVQEPVNQFKPEDIFKLGVLDLEQGEPLQAERRFKSALQALEKDKVSVEATEIGIRMIEHIGLAYMGQDKWADARLMFQRAFKGYKKLFGQNHEATLRTINHLGTLCLKQGRLKQAEKTFNGALRLEAALSNDRLSMPRTANNVGLLYCIQGRWTEAESILQHALGQFETCLGSGHMSTLRTIHELGVLYWSQGKHIEAKEMYLCALQGYERALSPEHIMTLRAVNCLGVLYWNQGKRTKARNMFRRAYNGLVNLLGPEHTSTLHVINNLGILYWSQGKLSEAKGLFNRAFRGLTERLGCRHPSTLCVRNNLANLHMGEDREDRAEESYKYVLEGLNETFGPNHTTTAHVARNLGNLYLIQGNLNDARDMFAQASMGMDMSVCPMHEMINAAFALIDH